MGLLLNDKFNVLENITKDISKDKLLSMVDNYFENLLNLDEKVFHPDFIYQIFWFNKDLDFGTLLVKHLENSLKQQRNAIRNNIKKSTFELDHLIKLIKNYNEKVTKFSSLCNDKDKFLKLSSNYLFELVISDPSVINFMKMELNNIYNDKKNYLVELFKIMENISELNPQLKIYEWFLLLASCSLDENIEEITKKIYSVPEDYQLIINFTSICKLYDIILSKYSFIKDSINIILSKSLDNFTNYISKIFKICNVQQINTIIKNNQSILDKIYDNALVHKLRLSEAILIFMNNNIFLISGDNINIDLFVNFATLFRLCCNLINNSTKDIINKIFGDYLINNVILDMVINNIHKNIINKNNESIINIINLNIREKDKFIDKYNRKLIERLLYKPDIEFEKKILDILVFKFEQKLIYKTDKIIADIDQSIQNYINFNNIKNINDLELKDKFNIVTTSYNVIDINHSEGILNLDTDINSELFNIMKIYNKFYNQRFENKRKLNIYPHFGEIIFDFMGKEFKMMPIQYLLLEHIYKNKGHTKNSILNHPMLINYSEKFKESILNSLLFGKIIKINRVWKIFEVTNNINEVSSYDFINVFFNITNYANTWEEKRQEDLMMTREDILSANINHYVKFNKINKDKLFEVISHNLNVFVLEKLLFDKVIETMIDKDYISIKDNIVEKLLW